MVTAERVWEALAEIPDPEIPVLSLVDLGVVRDVEVDGERVHVGFTPTFLGCPALEVMRDQMAERIRELGAEPDVEVLSEGWSSDWITEEGHRKLRDSGFAPPSGRAPATLVQIQTGTHPCPYCGSTDTRLDNLVRPDPVPLDPLLQRLPPAVRAVQDALRRRPQWKTCEKKTSTAQPRHTGTVSTTPNRLRNQVRKPVASAPRVPR